MVDTEKFNHLISHIVNNNIIFCIDDDIHDEGSGHQKSLHITINTSGYMWGSVLIDGGSTLNICPYDTLERMNVNPNWILSSHVVVRTFDGSRKDIVGEIQLPKEISPYTFNIFFQGLNITIGYNLLLGRPWIHMARAVPSTLHY